MASFLGLSLAIIAFDCVLRLEDWQVLQFLGSSD